MFRLVPLQYRKRASWGFFGRSLLFLERDGDEAQRFVVADAELCCAVGVRFRVKLEKGRCVAGLSFHYGAVAAAREQKAVGFELAVGAGDGVRRNAEITGELAHGGKFGARKKLTAGDLGYRLGFDLFEWRNGCRGVDLESNRTLGRGASP